METMTEGKRTRRLAALAAPLGPEKPPYYVRRPVPPGLERSFPADGWYWVPKGHQVAVFLAASFELAAHELHTMLELA
jgi:hypothetical protein